MASAILDRPDELSDDDLESELTIAASTRGRLRLERYERLLDENHRLEIVPSCEPKGSGFVCSRVRIVKVY
jgi:hypothetical protein